MQAAQRILPQSRPFSAAFLAPEGMLHRHRASLNILIVFPMSIGGRGLVCLGRSGRLLLLRLTSEKLRRWRGSGADGDGVGAVGNERGI